MSLTAASWQSVLDFAMGFGYGNAFVRMSQKNENGRFCLFSL
jgi:hypothetical protein